MLRHVIIVVDGDEDRQRQEEMGAHLEQRHIVVVDQRVAFCVRQKVDGRNLRIVELWADQNGGATTPSSDLKSGRPMQTSSHKVGRMPQLRAGMDAGSAEPRL